MDPYAHDPYAPLLSPEAAAPLASPWKRLLARWLDGILFWLALVPGVLLMFSGEDSPLFVAGLLLVAAGFFGFIAYQVVLLAREGQTVAKRALKLRVVDVDDDSNPGFVRAVLLREVLIAVFALVPVLGGLFALADALFIFSDDRRCLHDHIARTQVVDESEVLAYADPALM